MLIRSFNKAWEKERDIIESQIQSKLDEQIKNLMITLRAPGYMDDETRLSLNKMRNELILRKAFAIYESEEIARNRMQLRSSYLALIMSSVALIISMSTVLIKL